MAKTKLGKWSLGLILGMVGLFVIGLSLADTEVGKSPTD